MNITRKAFSLLSVIASAFGVGAKGVEAKQADQATDPVSNGGYFLNTGEEPRHWGTSRACARMVRKNRMRKLGIKGSRI